MSAGTTWLLHGLVVVSEVAIDARPAPHGAEPDLTVTLSAPGPVPGYGQPLPGEPLSWWDDGARSALTVARVAGTGRRPQEADDVLVCFHGVALATIDGSRSHVTLTLAEGVDPALAPVLVSGTVMAVVLMLRGHPVLHASAVRVRASHGQGAVAFVGRSGMGKSTMAAVMCRDGATLLTDDVLRTDLVGSGVTAWPGATSARLRPAAEQLGREVSPDLTTTADGRFAAPLADSGVGPVELLAIVVPLPDREAARVQVTRLAGPGAVLTLAGFPRILGWRDPHTSGEALRHWGTLAERVPVVQARIPWGPPFADRLGTQLLEQVL